MNEAMHSMLNSELSLRDDVAPGLAAALDRLSGHDAHTLLSLIVCSRFAVTPLAR